MLSWTAVPMHVYAEAAHMRNSFARFLAVALMLSRAVTGLLPSCALQALNGVYGQCKTLMYTFLVQEDGY